MPLKITRNRSLRPTGGILKIESTDMMQRYYDHVMILEKSWYVVKYLIILNFEADCEEV